MKKFLLSMFLVCWSVVTVLAAGVSNPYGNNTAALQNSTVQSSLTNAVQLADLRTNLETALEKTSKLSFTKRMVLKSMLKKVKKAEKTNADLNGLLVTIGIICIIIGLVFLVLGVLSGGWYYGGAGGWLALGLILFLIGKFVDL